MTDPKEKSDNPETKDQLFPLAEGDGSTTLLRIIALAKTKLEKALSDRTTLANQNLSGKDINISLDDFYSLQDIIDVLKYDIELSGKNKTTEAINDAFVEMLDIRKNGVKKKGYLYPVFFERGGQLKAKIVIAVAFDNKLTPLSLFRPFFFKHTKFAIEPFIKNFDDSKTSKYYTNPEISLVHKKESTIEFNPYGLSLLEDLREEIKDAFNPFSFIELQDFHDDVYNYIRSEGLLKIINSKYYIYKREIVVNQLGEPKVEPEVYFHYISLFTIMEDLVTVNLLALAGQFGLDVSKSQIKDYIKKFPKITSRNISEYTDRYSYLSEIVSRFNITSKMNKSQSGLVSSIKTGFTILSDLSKFFKDVENEIFLQKNKQITQTLIDGIESHLTNSKTLYVFSPKKPFPESIDQKLISSELISQIKDIVLSKYHYFESQDSNGNKIFFLLSPQHCLKVVVNLATIFEKDEKYKNQYKIAKLLREKMIKEGIQNLDASLDPAQKKKLEESLVVLNRSYIESEEKEEIKKNFNNLFAYASGSFYLIILLYMYIFYNNTILLIMSPLALFVGYVSGRMFKKKKNQILFNNPNIELNIGVTIIPELKPYIPILKDTIFSNKTNAEDIVMSTSDMVIYFKSNLSTLMSKNLTLFNNLPQEKTIELLGEVARSLSIIIKIPKYVQNKHFPEEVLVNKDFLKDNFKKAQVIEFYKSNLKQASDMKITDDLRYYKYILEILECDFSEY